MDPKVVCSLPMSPSSRGPLALGVSGGVVVVATATNSDISMQCIHQSEQREGIVLRGHYELVTLLSFSEFPTATQPTLLCSVSADAVLLWNVEECLKDTGSASCSKHLTCITSLGGVVTHVSFSEDLQCMALCKGLDVVICDIQRCEIDTTLIGHTAAVTCSCFSPHHQHRTVISASEDRTFKLWDLESSSLLYQSAVVSASPFLCLSASPHQEVMAIGTADGTLRVYDLSEGGSYQCLLKCDVIKEVERLDSHKTTDIGGATTTISSIPSWRNSPHHVTEAPPTSFVEMGPAILALYHCASPPSECVDSEPSIHPISSSEHVREVLKSSATLLAATHTHLLLFNASTLELLDSLDFRDPLLSADISPSVIAAADLTSDPHNPYSCYCGVVGMFSALATVLKVDYSGCGRRKGHYDGDEEPCANSIISVLSSVPLVPNSPLRAELSLKQPRKTIQPAVSSGRKPGKLVSSGLDRPVTFKSKVKSSGYSDTPRMKPFTPKTNLTKPTKKRPVNSKPPSLSQREYPVDGDHPTQLADALQLTDRPTAINSSCFSGGGQYLTCACADKNAYAVRMPPSLGRTHAFVGHNESVLSASWSHSGEWMISSSKDRTVRLWTTSQKDPLLCLNKTMHNFKEATDSKANRVFTGDITSAQFYYLDKFILLTTSNNLLMYKYHIDTSKPDDIKRYQSNTRYKLVTSLNMETAHAITAMSTINDFHSYIVLVAGSNKSVEVFDMNVGQSIRTNIDTHTRPVHCIQQNKGSKFVSHPPSAYDLYLTAAVTDGIKLWDMRANRCVSRFTSHHNQALPLSANFSPCGRFIATGSEDKCAYVYDLRTPSPLHKLRGHSDTVTTVAYNPLTPMLVTGTLNGTLKFFGNEHTR